MLAAARAGEDAAWHELFDRFKRMLLVSIECRIQGTLRSRFDAEDVLQEAFSKAWQKIDSFTYDGEGSLRRWLKQIVTHEFYNLIQGADGRHQGAAQDGAGLDSMPDPKRHPSQIVAEFEAHENVLKHMGQLDEEEQELITMRVFERMDWHEVGRIVGCNRTTARERFDRAIANLARRVS